MNLVGIKLPDCHRELLDRRSRRLGILDRDGLDSPLDAVEQGELATMRTRRTGQRLTVAIKAYPHETTPLKP